MVERALTNLFTGTWLADVSQLSGWFSKESIECFKFDEVRQTLENPDDEFHM